MAISIFGVGHENVHSEYFPSLISFSGSTKPTATTVGTMIEKEAARLLGALAAAGVDGDTISADAGATYPSSYAWCQDTITLGVAIRVMRAIAGDGAVPKYWQETLESRYEMLKESGGVVLGGDAPGGSSTGATGPRSHISEHDLDTGDEALISNAVPRFRRSDDL